MLMEHSEFCCLSIKVISDFHIFYSQAKLLADKFSTASFTLCCAAMQAVLSCIHFTGDINMLQYIILGKIHRTE